MLPIVINYRKLQIILCSYKLSLWYTHCIRSAEKYWDRLLASAVYGIGLQKPKFAQLLLPAVNLKNGLSSHSDSVIFVNVGIKHE